ncbi:tail tube protein [Campylobacter phage CJLB-5]|nr:tail tube protein [Campylobacter phage CJLB-5]
MAKRKNALRKHYIAPFDPATQDTEPAKEKYKWLAKDITSSSPEVDEQTDDSADFAGDGTPVETITSVKRGRSFEGKRNDTDEAQNMIADMQDEVGDGRKVWYKEVDADGKNQRVGVATVSGIEIGDGEATEHEGFKAKIMWDQKPKKSAVVPG